MVDKWKNENNVLFKQKMIKHLIIFEKKINKNNLNCAYIFIIVHIKMEIYFFFLTGKI